MKRKCLKCKYEWDSHGRKKPKCCPACKSYTWDQKLRDPAEGIATLVSSTCMKCRVPFIEGDKVYRVLEAVYVGSKLEFPDKRQQGVFCEPCAPNEDEFPFVSAEEDS